MGWARSTIFRASSVRDTLGGGRRRCLIHAATPRITVCALQAGWLSRSLSVDFHEVAGWDPVNLCYCCAIIPDPMGSWLYEKVLGYDFPEGLSKNIVQCFLYVCWKGRSLYKFLGYFWEVNILVFSFLVLEDLYRGILENSRAKTIGQGFQGIVGHRCFFLTQRR